MENTLILLIGMFLEIFFLWPNFLYKIIKHPIIWVGGLIKLIEDNLNKEEFSYNLKKFFGFLTLFICVFVGLAFFKILSKVFNDFLFVEIFYIFIVWSLMCSRSLYVHIKEICDNLKINNLKKAKYSLSKVVGRDTKNLNKKAIIRASLESLSESTSDGIVAPIFWYLLFGIPGLIIFKIVNTLDSMIGYKTKKYFAFGYASAKMDDLLNFIPARITGLVFVLLSSNPFSTLSIMLKNATKLNSPNAGWPESAFAGALMIRLGGPKSYSGIPNNDKWLNETKSDPTNEKFEEGLKLYKKSIFVVILTITFYLFCQFIKNL